MNTPALEVSIVMPCLDEAQTVGLCVGKARDFLAARGISGEVIVADNGSSDDSVALAQAAGATVVHAVTRGYGAALAAGIATARGQYIIIGDADDSYDFSALDGFVENLRSGCDLVMGNRFRGHIHSGAMPWLHRYLGNPVLTRLGRMFFGSPCGDFHCGLRGFSKAAFTRMDVRTTGMEFASEIVVKASLLGMRISEVPVDLYRDGRGRPAHLRTWRDGWRHLRFLLLYSPRWLFFYPGLAFVLIGAVSALLLMRGPLTVAGLTFDVHTLMYSAMAVLIGVQALIFGAFARLFAAREGLLPGHQSLAMMRGFRLEHGALLGLVLIVLGLSGSIYAVVVWGQYAFGDLNPRELLRVVIPSAVALGLGVEVIFSAFFMSILMLARR